MIKQRNMWMQVVLMIVTLGIYSIYWFYVTSRESDIAHSLNELLGEFPKLMLGSYPRIGEEHYSVLLTLESRDEAYLERAIASLLERLPSDGIYKVE